MAALTGKVKCQLPEFKLKAPEVREVVKEGVRKWIQVILTKWPSYTGTMRGGLVPVGRLVNMVIPRIEEPGRGVKRFFKHGGISRPLGFGQGQRYTTTNLREDTQAGGFWKSSRVVYTFYFDSSLPYVVWNENRPSPLPLKVPPPYKIMPVAMSAMRAYVVQTLPTIIKAAVSFRKITVGG